MPRPDHELAAGEVRAEPLHLDSRESTAAVNRLFEEFQSRQAHALAVLDDASLTRFERAALATKMLQVLAGYRGRKPRDGDAGRPAIAALSVAVMERRTADLRAVVEIDGPAAGLTDLQVKHEVAQRLDLSWERLRQILTGQLGTGARRRRAKSDRPAGRPRITDALPSRKTSAAPPEPASAPLVAAPEGERAPGAVPPAEVAPEPEATSDAVERAVDGFRDALRSR